MAAAANPVNLETGPGGDLFYVDFDGGTIRRIRYFSANRPPVAVATASPTTGAAPLTVNFDGGGSSDPDGDILGYAWIWTATAPMTTPPPPGRPGPTRPTAATPSSCG